MSESEELRETLRALNALGYRVVKIVPAPPQPILETPRLRLLPMTRNHAPDLHAAFSDLETQFDDWPASLPVEEIAERLDERYVRSETISAWVLSDKETEKVIGWITVRFDQPPHNRAELGYALARSAWRQGYATEAGRELLGHLFGTLALNRIEAFPHPENEASIRLLERLGFQREGVARKRHFMSGEFHDAAMYGLLRSDLERK